MLDVGCGLLPSIVGLRGVCDKNYWHAWYVLKYPNDVVRCSAYDHGLYDDDVE